MPTKLAAVAAAEILPRNSLRKSIGFQNEDSTDSIFVKRERSENTTVSATDHDWKLGPGGILTLNSQTDGESAIRGRWTFIASANTPRLAYFETKDLED